MDMFDTVFGDELMDPKKGLLYREKILEPAGRRRKRKHGRKCFQYNNSNAGSEDATVLLKNFLGRDPKPEAFLKSKGIDAAA